MRRVGKVVDERDDGAETANITSDSPAAAHRQEIGHAEDRDVADLSTIVDELRQVQQVLTDELDLARTLNAAKNDFLATMSHEMRTPLAALVGFAEMLGDQNLPERQAHWVEQMRRAAEHLRYLIDGVLDVTLIELGKIELSIDAIPLRDVVEDCIAIVEPIATGRTMVVEHRRLDGLGPVVLADRRRLTQVLLNLLTNALKFAPSDSTVRVTTRFDGTTSRLEVRDEGPGIDPAALELLFRPFERLDAKNRGVAGAGLGLAVSRGLIEAMQGRIDVISSPGQGTTFAVELPNALDQGSNR